MTNITELEDTALPLDNGCKAQEWEEMHYHLYLRRRCQRQINTGNWFESNAAAFITGLDKILDAFQEWEEAPTQESARRSLKDMSWAIRSLQNISIDYKVKVDYEDGFTPDGDSVGDLLMEYPKMSKEYIRMAESLKDLPCEPFDVGLTDNSDDMTFPGFQDMPPFPSIRPQTVEPMYYHQEEKS